MPKQNRQNSRNITLVALLLFNFSAIYFIPAFKQELNNLDLSINLSSYGLFIAILIVFIKNAGLWINFQIIKLIFSYFHFYDKKVMFHYFILMECSHEILRILLNDFWWIRLLSALIFFILLVQSKSIRLKRKQSLKIAVSYALVQSLAYFLLS